MVIKNNKTSENQRQSDKEKAVLKALNKDMALIRRELEVYGMKKDGSTVFISRSDLYENLWHDTLKALEEK